jgi:hypothetical protein
MLVAAMAALQPNEGRGQTLTGQALFTDACAMLAGARISGFSEPQENEWLANCAKAGEMCQETKNFIEKRTGRPVSDLVCPVGGAKMFHLDEAPQATQTRFDDACALLAASRISNVHDLKEPDWISNCSKNPDRKLCETTKKFIEDKAQRLVPELVCGTQGNAR